jgi:ketosteroid isomerase-like protein
MTSEAVAVVRAFFDLAAAGDVDGIRDCFDPDVVWFGTRGGLDENQIIRGPDAVLEYIREIEETWEHFDVEIERLIELGDTVVAFLGETAQARHGDLEVQNDTAVIIKLRQQKMVEVRGYLDRDEAIKAAGLTE